MKKFKTFIALLLAALMLGGCASPSQSSGGTLDALRSYVDSFSSWVEKKTEALNSFLHRKDAGGTAIVDTVQEFFEDKIEDIEDIFDGKEDTDTSREEMKAIRDEVIVPFSEMVYSRPDVDGLINDVYALEEALDALENDHEYLTRGGVFPERLLKIWVDRKRKEARRIENIPHPAEFERYFDL